MSNLGDAADVNPVIKFLPHTLHGRWLGPACLFLRAQAAPLLEFHLPLVNCFVRRWFCLVHGPKHPLQRHNWLSFGKFQDTVRFLIPCSRHVKSRRPLSGETCKYVTALSTQKNVERFYTYWYTPFCCVCLGCWAAEIATFGGLLNYCLYE